jgi:hypothetical protein
MDKALYLEHRLLADALKAMEPLGLRGRILQHGGPKLQADAIVGLQLAGRQVRYVAEVKRTLRPATLGAAIHQVRVYARDYDAKPLLVTDHVTPPLADALRAEGIEFIDAAGNAFLNHPPVLVFIKGQRPTEARTPLAERRRAFQPTGLQVLFAMLARPELVDRPYREIAVNAGVAHGTVGWVMAEMPGLGYVAEVGGHRRLINGERLLGEWTEAYARTLRPRLLLGRFRGDLAGLEARADKLKAVLLGGELAAARMTRYLRPATATFYAPAIDPKVLLTLTLQTDAEGNVDFRRRFWAFDGDNPQLVPALLVYADLLAIGDARCRETAELLRGPLLDRLI